MEKSTGGVSFDIRFIDSGNGSENCYSVKSRRLVGIYGGDWSLKEDGTVNASMALARECLFQSALELKVKRWSWTAGS